MIKIRRTCKPISIILIAIIISVCMLSNALINGSMVYGAEAPAGDDNFNYNGYSATQLKKISECISGVVPESECPSYEASSKDYYKDYYHYGTANHANMPTGVISTKSGWLKWADAAMKANSYDGVYGTLRIASVGGGTGTTSSSTDVRFRLIGINQDNRADGTGKAGLTFQAIDYYNIESSMNTTASNSGGWRDSMLRKNLNDESTGTIWNTIQSTDFKNNITPVLKTTNNNGGKRSIDTHTSNASSITVDKLFILSQSEMGMPIINNYNNIVSYHFDENSDANVHYYDVNSSYNNTIKLSSDDDFHYYEWFTLLNYIYAGNTYQWWMLPAGSRKMSNGSKAYHNTDLASYCNLDYPTHYDPYWHDCNYHAWWLRCAFILYYNSYNFSSFSRPPNGGLEKSSAASNIGSVLAFSF